MKLSDAGRYTCLEVGSILSADSELIVLASDPICLTNLNEHANFSIEELYDIELTCNVTYSGNWAPVMSWHQDAGSVITTGVVNYSVAYNNTFVYKTDTYSLKVVATRNLTGTKYTCITYFTEVNKPDVNATNVPNYTHTWSLPHGITVLFAPSNMQITPRQPLYRLGDQLTCSADGNPPPTFTWKDLVNGGTYDGPVLTVVIINQANFMCIATNSILQRQATTTQTITFDVFDHNQAAFTYYVSGGVIGTVVLILLVIGLTACYKKEKRRKYIDVKEIARSKQDQNKRKNRSNEQRVFQTVGTDGTQYAELAMMTEQPSSIKVQINTRQSRMKHNDAATVVYARIDHTANIMAIYP